MQQGKKLDYDSFNVALTASLRHNNHNLGELVNELLNYEEFHATNDSSFINKIYIADKKHRLFESPDGMRLLKII